MLVNSLNGILAALGSAVTMLVKSSWVTKKENGDFM